MNFLNLQMNEQQALKPNGSNGNEINDGKKTDLYTRQTIKRSNSEFDSWFYHMHLMFIDMRKSRKTTF